MTWREMLHQAAQNATITQVAEQLGYSRAAVSLVLAGKYPGSIDRIAVRVLDVFGRVQCPFLGAEMGRRECADHHVRPVPTSSPRALKHWRACQTCPNKETQPCN
jgi:hypothetical protein